MSEFVVKKFFENSRLTNRRLGIALAVLVILYIAAVIAFIIIY